MSSNTQHTQNTNTNSDTHTTKSHQGRGNGRGGHKGRGGYKGRGGSKGRNSPRGHREDTRTECFRMLPLDRNPDGKGSPAIVMGKNGSYAKLVHEKTGCKVTIISDSEQRRWTYEKGIEANTTEVRVAKVVIDPEVTFEKKFNRLNAACKMLRKAVLHWVDIEYPPDDEEHSGHDDEAGHEAANDEYHSDVEEGGHLEEPAPAAEPEPEPAAEAENA